MTDPFNILSTGGSWNTSGNWTGGIPDSNTASATFSQNFTASPIVTLNNAAGFTINQITYDDTGASGDSTLAINAGTGGKLILAGTTPTITTSSPLSISVALEGATSLRKSGSGTLSLSGTNTYTGVTTIDLGTVNVSGDHSAADGGWSFQDTGGTVNFQAGSTIAVRAGANFTYTNTANIVLAKATGAGNGSATLNLGGGTFTTTRGISNTAAGTGTGSTNLNFSNGGTLKLSANINPLIIQGSTTFLVRTNNAAGAVIDTNGNDATIPVAISGVGGLTKTGTGTLTLSAANTYAGDTTVTGGTLVLGADNISNDASRVTIGSSGILKLDYAGTDTVQRLYVNGNRMPNGVFGYNSTDSIAQSINSYFEATGTGTVSDTVAPTLASANIVDDKAGGPVVANTLVNYTVTFSEEMNASALSAADFGNAGTATFTIGTVTQVSPSAFLVPVTPTSAGTLQLSVIAGAEIKDFVNNPLDTTSAIADDTTLTVNAATTSPAGPPPWMITTTSKSKRPIAARKTPCLSNSSAPPSVPAANSLSGSTWW